MINGPIDDILQEVSTGLQKTKLVFKTLLEFYSKEFSLKTNEHQQDLEVTQAPENIVRLYNL